MADWNLPTLTSNYSDFLDYLKARDEDSAKMFDGVGSNLGIGFIRWNSGNKRFEKYDGTSWTDLVSKYMIDVDSVDGKNVDDTKTTSDYLWTAYKINNTFIPKTDSNNFLSVQECINNIADSYVNVAKVTASSGSSKIKMVISGTVTNIIYNITAEVISNGYTYGQILVKSMSGGYSQMFIKISANKNSGYFNVLLKGLSGVASCPVTVKFYSDNKTTVTPYTTNPALDYTDTVLEYQTYAGDYQFNSNVTGAGLYFNNYKVWHSGNDGTGSDLDAGYLEGHRSTDFLQKHLPASGNIDNMLTSGMFTYSGGSVTNLPSGAGSAGTIQVIGGYPSTSLATQILISYPNKIFIRYGDSGSTNWQSWVEIGNTQRQLGTTLTDETANRALNTTYTNSSDYVLTVYAGVSGYGSATLVIDGKNTARTYSGDSARPTHDALIGFVPPGKSYEVNADANISLSYWMEM